MTLKNSWWAFWVYSFGNNICIAKELENKFKLYYAIYADEDKTILISDGEIFLENNIRYDSLSLECV